MRMAGKVAIVTGSTRGIGKGIAHCCAQEGAKVVVTGRSADRGEAVVADIKKAGGDAIFLRADVGEENAEAQLRDARLSAQQNIIQQLGALSSAEERIRIQQASVAAAQEDLRVQQQRYSLGASTLLDLLTSQSTLTQARAALIQARLDYRLARAQIEATIGRDLQ